MTISQRAFRLRYLLQLAICALGFLAPWNRWLHLDQGRTFWLFVASLLGRTGWLSFDAATVGILLLAITLAFAAAGLRTWASADPDPAMNPVQSVRSTWMQSDQHRHETNLFGVGTIFHTLALMLLMPPSGAAVTIILMLGLQYWLTNAEGSALRTGPAPSDLVHHELSTAPTLPTAASYAPKSKQGHWGRAFFAESYLWGAAISFAALGWRYNALLILQGILVSLGISLILRAVLPRNGSESPAF